ncbi:MAG: putative Tau-tubulin kinase 1 [Streblomastix strix]|uniref:non-specific serine/threonine protein kinase n=1 Tax=Streblomastix strix TaxID=222440 RepID=A0A5J4WT50_9EUKA|nr:MAG: putative Tau-tubulin kinase 1 [Streblomastix strix]
MVMRAMKGSEHFAKFYQCGTHESFRFVSMDLLGPSIINVVNRCRPYMFTLLQMLKFGVQAIHALHELHKAGFVHRDVKPDNFVIGNTQETAGTIYLIDFGLCKKMIQHQGKLIKPPLPSKFRGTMRYSSPKAHLKIELGRSDDLISLLYMMIEFYIGKLPWTGIYDNV